MLLGYDRHVGIVIQCHELLAPPDDDGKARVQAGGGCRLQRLRPILDGAQCRTRPIERAHMFAHGAAAGKRAARSTGLPGSALSWLHFEFALGPKDSATGERISSIFDRLVTGYQN